LAREAAAKNLIEKSDVRVEAGAIRRQLNELQFEASDPETFWELGDAYGYDVQVRWGTQREQSHFEVGILDRSMMLQISPLAPLVPNAVRDWSVYSNDPMENGFRQQVIPELRDYLKRRLPEYMIPSAWMILRELPLTPSGKVDRLSLPAPQSRTNEIGKYVAPRTELERTVADIWAQVLRVDQVGVRDNFFELGGHSLLATRVITHIGHILDVDLPLRVMFEKPTVEGLSDSILKEIAAEVAMEAP
jgi:hypothetical protein